MKTKIRTLIAICALGFIGLININAIADNKKAVNTEVVTEKIEMLTTESVMSEDAFLESAEALTALEADAQIERYATRQILLEKNANAVSDDLTIAQASTASEADSEIEKYAQKLLSLQATKNGK